MPIFWRDNCGCWISSELCAKDLVRLDEACSRILDWLLLCPLMASAPTLLAILIIGSWQNSCHFNHLQLWQMLLMPQLSTLAILIVGSWKNSCHFNDWQLWKMLLMPQLSTFAILIIGNFGKCCLCHNCPRPVGPPLRPLPAPVTLVVIIAADPQRLSPFSDLSNTAALGRLLHQELVGQNSRLQKSLEIPEGDNAGTQCQNNGYFQSESMPDMQSKRRETPAQYCHQMNLADVDCARPLIKVYHFTAIVKLLLESAYSGILVPCCLELRFFHISKYLEYHRHVVHPTNQPVAVANHSNSPMWFLPLVHPLLVFPLRIWLLLVRICLFFKFTFSWQ